MKQPKNPEVLADNPSPVEKIKDNSNFLRGRIVEGLNNPITGAIFDDDTQLTKFHGTYMQDDRDTRVERKKQKLEPLYSFMIRVRLPGGICSTQQWLAMDRLADQYANGTLKITTRQTFQVHCVLKRDLKATMQGINAYLMDTIAACGDVNRNVLVNSNPHQSPTHQEVYDIAKAMSEHLLPKTTAYHEIWLDGEKVAGSAGDDEPIYGKHYLPRKWKTAFAIPPENDVDIFTNDLGFIAIVKDDKLLGFNITVGGGMGMTHNTVETYPRLADVIGFIEPGEVNEVATLIMQIQRDYGDRTNRKHARFKYTIDDNGLDWFKTELTKRLGRALPEPKPYQFTMMGDTYGWKQGTNGKWFLTLHIEHGRVKDTDDAKQRTGLVEICKIHDGDIRLTCNQNIIIGNVSTENKAAIDALVQQYNIDQHETASGLRKNSIACVALPTCALAFAEAERYLPTLMDHIDVLLDKHGLRQEPMVIRMTGCPNGCGRPFNAEIGFVGKSMGRYNMYLGAAFEGDRLNKQYRENIDETEILRELDVILADYAATRNPGEHIGDFTIRKGYIAATTEGRLFHENQKV